MALDLRTNETKKKGIKYEVIREIDTICITDKNEMKLRVISWNGQPANYDLRWWGEDSEGNEIARKGIIFDMNADLLSALISTLQTELDTYVPIDTDTESEE